MVDTSRAGGGMLSVKAQGPEVAQRPSQASEMLRYIRLIVCMAEKSRPGGLLTVGTISFPPEGGGGTAPGMNKQTFSRRLSSPRRGWRTQIVEQATTRRRIAPYAPTSRTCWRRRRASKIAKFDDS